jgi:hypothetical protein
MNVKYLKVALVTTALVLISNVNAAVIDFDSLTSNEIVTGQFASQGVLISSLFGDVTIFNNATFADTGTNSLNGGGFQGVTVTFVNPNNVLQAATTDFFQMTLGDIDIPGNGMIAYDVNGSQIGQVVSSCVANFACPGLGLFETFSLSVAGIHTVVISAGGQILDGTAQPEATVDTFIYNDAMMSPQYQYLQPSGYLAQAYLVSLG